MYRQLHNCLYFNEKCEHRLKPEKFMLLSLESLEILTNPHYKMLTQWNKMQSHKIHIQASHLSIFVVIVYIHQQKQNTCFVFLED